MGWTNGTRLKWRRGVQTLAARAVKPVSKAQFNGLWFIHLVLRGLAGASVDSADGEATDDEDVRKITHSRIYLD